ncbi:MAG: DUF4830 domain-containing protein [Clostridia bacterium]|nr:DUF4830 domain-containing protein [Clostridia bacterium]
MIIMGTISKRLKLFLLIAALCMAVLLIIDATGFGKEALSVSVPLTGNLDTAGRDFLKTYGWEASATPTEVQEITLPGEFNRVYTQYNDLQLAQGFDLTPYRGKAVKRYTYEVYNYPDLPTGVVANLLIYKDKVIGGDVCTRALDGFMHGFSLEETGVLQQTFFEMMAS